MSLIPTPNVPQLQRLKYVFIAASVQFIGNSLWMISDDLNGLGLVRIAIHLGFSCLCGLEIWISFEAWAAEHHRTARTRPPSQS